LLLPKPKKNLDLNNKNEGGIKVQRAHDKKIKVLPKLRRKNGKQSCDFGKITQARGRRGMLGTGELKATNALADGEIKFER